MELEQYVNNTPAMIKGAWQDYKSARFLLARMDNSAYRAATTDAGAEMGREPTNEEAREIMVVAFVGTVLKGWEGVKVGGKEVPYSEVTARKLLIKFPRLLDELVMLAWRLEGFRDKDLQKEIDAIVPFCAGQPVGAIRKAS